MEQHEIAPHPQAKAARESKPYTLNTLNYKQRRQSPKHVVGGDHALQGPKKPEPFLNSLLKVFFGMLPLILTGLNRDDNRGYCHPYQGP